MPTTTRSRTLESRARTELEQHAAELEALGLGIAPRLPSDDRSEFVERAGIGAGQPRRGALAADPPTLPPERSMRRLIGLLAAAASVKLSGCRPIGGSAMR